MKKIFLAIFSLIIFVIFGVFVLTFSVTGNRESIPSISEYSALLSEEKPGSEFNNNSVMKLLTLNIAHGRKDGISQIFQSKEKIKCNLDDIVSYIQHPKYKKRRILYRKEF